MFTAAMTWAANERIRLERAGLWDGEHIYGRRGAGRPPRNGGLGTRATRRPAARTHHVEAA